MFLATQGRLSDKEIQIGMAGDLRDVVVSGEDGKAMADSNGSDDRILYLLLLIYIDQYYFFR